MRQVLRIAGFLTVVVVCEYTSPPAHPETLQQLFNGETITVGDKVFRNWEKYDYLGDIDPSLITVEGLDDDPLHPGLRFRTNGAIASTGQVQKFISVGFTVESLGSQLIKDNTLELTDYQFSGSGVANNRVWVYEGVFNENRDNLLADKLVQAYFPAAAGDDVLFDSADFAPRQIVSVNFIMGAMTSYDHSASLGGFDMRFSQTPEPTSLVALIGMGLVGALGYVWRRRRSR